MSKFIQRYPSPETFDLEDREEIAFGYLHSFHKESESYIVNVSNRYRDGKMPDKIISIADDVFGKKSASILEKDSVVLFCFCFRSINAMYAPTYYTGLFTHQKRQKKEASHKFNALMRSLEIYKWHQKGIKNDVRCRQTLGISRVFAV